jgi:hypothetical protein
MTWWSRLTRSGRRVTPTPEPISGGLPTSKLKLNVAQEHLVREFVAKANANANARERAEIANAKQHAQKRRTEQDIAVRSFVARPLQEKLELLLVSAVNYEIQLSATPDRRLGNRADTIIDYFGSIAIGMLGGEAGLSTPLSTVSYAKNISQVWKDAGIPTSDFEIAETGGSVDIYYLLHDKGTAYEAGLIDLRPSTSELKSLVALTSKISYPNVLLWKLLQSGAGYQKCFLASCGFARAENVPNLKSSVDNLTRRYCLVSRDFSYGQEQWTGWALGVEVS